MIVPAPVTDVLGHDIFGNTLSAWLGAALTASITLLITLVLRRVLVSRLGALAARTTNHVDDMVVDMLKETRTWVLVAFAVLVALSPLRFTSTIERVIAPSLRLVVLWQLAVWLVSGVTFWIRQQLEHRTGTHDRTSVAMISAMGVGAKVLIWLLIFLTALKSVFGVDITALITGLGVSGIAIALAVQNILGDLLAALAIVFDKPFDVGDSIGVDNVSGTVERIGLKTTHIRSVTGEQIVMGNSDLLKSRLRNFKRMHQRRALFTLDVPFDTGPDVLAKIPSMLEQIITAQPKVRFDRSHIASFTESAVRIETVYYLLDPDYKLYMDTQQAINLDILRVFNTEQLRFALPSRTVYHEGPNAKELAVGPQPPATD